MSTTPALFAGLLDDAAMFPPGNASPGDAIAEHLRYRTGEFSTLVGPLLIDHRRWQEFTDAHSRAGSPSLDVRVIGVATAPPSIPAGVRVSGFEVPVASLPLPDPGDAFVVAGEITAAPDRSKLLTAMAERRSAGQRIIAKYRTGGTSAEAFPGVQELAQVIAEAAEARVPLKFTAGLHHAVRFTDEESGFEHHGFLNLMVAVARARRAAVALSNRGDLASVVSALAERDPATLADEVRSWSTDQVRRVREAFVSFGCCGLQEPVADLVALGLLSRGSR